MPGIIELHSHAVPSLPSRLSAKHTLSLPQAVALVMLLAILAIGILAGTKPTEYLLWSIAAMTVVYLISLLHRSYLVAHSTHSGLVKVSQEELAGLDEADLPFYTLLVPLYHEREVLPTLARNLINLDYPQNKLDIKLLLEKDDRETIQTAISLGLPDCFELVIVPPSHPRTKPKVCNVGLFRARGEYCGIYDAEDRPEADQLKKVIVAFKKVEKEVVCLQARLDFFNPDTNLLTKFFAAEYSTWFNLFLPGLGKLELPVPLGGTSNHFRTSTLRELGGWDPYNVTEDCDLGTRIARRHLRVKTLDSTTWEEANGILPSWIRQRSRWIKGYIQTYLVHMRNPFRLLKDLGPANFLSFQMVVGAVPLTTLVNPLFWAMTLHYIFTRSELIESFFPGPIYYFGMTVMILGNFAFMYFVLLGAMLGGQYINVKWMLLSPLYWILMSVAAWKGLLQLIVNPHYWEKTRHGFEKEIALAPFSAWKDSKGVKPEKAGLQAGSANAANAHDGSLDTRRRAATLRRKNRQLGGQIPARKLLYPTLSDGQMSLLHEIPEDAQVYLDYENGHIRWMFSTNEGLSFRELKNYQG